MSDSARARREDVHGILLLDKPLGLSSNAALQRAKRALNARKAGHTGSLDPAATGLLPLCFGDATRVTPFLLDADKRYSVSARLGVRTDSGDLEGAEIERQPVPTMSTADWEAIAERFVGEQEQIPPMYSALKHDGQRLYKLARKGETVERPPRAITIHSLALTGIDADCIHFDVSCSKGTYIRTLVEDLASAAGTLATTIRLHRTGAGPFDAADMHPLAAVQDDPARARSEWLLPPDAALGHLPSVALDSAKVSSFCEGQRVSVADSGLAPALYRVYGPGGRFHGIGAVLEEGSLKPKKVFKNSIS